MSTGTPRKLLLLLAALALILLTCACAVQLPNFHAVSAHPKATILPPVALAPQIPDPPSRAIRVSYLQGSVSFRAAGTGNWSRAELNRPLAEGDALWVDGAARAELHLGSAAIRLDARTPVDILRFDDRILQAKVTMGVLGISVRRPAPGEVVEIDTPNAAISLSRPGEYRIEIDPGMDSTFVSVQSGEAEVSGTRLEFNVTAGQRVNLSGPEAEEYGRAAPLVLDKFDDFCKARDRRESQSISAKYVPAQTNGYFDLDEAGDWRIDAHWGSIWTPRSLPANWAPYRFGHWVWMEPWGWTWVDDASWGFAPFHYGRWILLNGTWSWIAGPENTPAVYAPALVAFIGGGRSGLRYFYWIGRAGIAWFPLGPGEIYDPPYRCSASYLAGLNIGDTDRDGHSNLPVPGAVTSVAVDAFVRGRSVAEAAVPISPRRAALAFVSGTAPPVAPVAQSVAPRWDRFVLEPPARQAELAVVSRRDPALQPIPFRERRPLLDAHPGYPLASSESQQLRRQSGEAPPYLVRPARLGDTGPLVIPPQVLERTPQEIARQKEIDARRLHEIQTELRRVHPPAQP